jgi:hypothetical protein
VVAALVGTTALTAGAATPAQADSQFTVTGTPPSGGKVTYRVSYAGDAGHSIAAASKAIEVYSGRQV